MKPARRPREVRIGPFVFVGGWSAPADDKWSHRRGEPRMFAVLWLLYLLACTGITLSSVRSLGAPTPEKLLFTGRSLLMLLALGLCVMWPMVRLSQQPPPRPVRAVLADLLVLLIPAAMVCAPLPLIIGWRWQVTAGCGLMLAAWSLLVGGLIALATGRGTRLGRTWWMSLTLAAVGIGPLVKLATPVLTGALMPGWWNMLSPLTGVGALTAAPSGLTPAMSANEWAFALAPGGVGVLLLIGAAMLGGEPDPYPPSDRRSAFEPGVEPDDPASPG